MPLMQPLPKKKPTYQVLEDEDELDFVEPALVEANGPLEMSLSPHIAAAVDWTEDLLVPVVKEPKKQQH
jgi:hypothetical protein